MARPRKSARKSPKRKAPASKRVSFVTASGERVSFPVKRKRKVATYRSPAQKAATRKMLAAAKRARR